MSLEHIAREVLLVEMLRQWISNHAEHCGKFLMKNCLPHEGECYWEFPEVVKELTSEELNKAFDEAHGGW